MILFIRTPDGLVHQVEPKANENARYMAWRLATLRGLLKGSGKRTYRLRASAGVLQPNLRMKNYRQPVGEILKLEIKP